MGIIRTIIITIIRNDGNNDGDMRTLRDNHGDITRYIGYQYMGIQWVYNRNKGIYGHIINNVMWINP